MARGQSQAKHADEAKSGGEKMGDQSANQPKGGGADDQGDAAHGKRAGPSDLPKQAHDPADHGRFAVVAPIRAAPPIPVVGLIPRQAQVTGDQQGGKQTGEGDDRQKNQAAAFPGGTLP